MEVVVRMQLQNIPVIVHLDLLAHHVKQISMTVNQIHVTVVHALTVKIHLPAVVFLVLLENYVKHRLMSARVIHVNLVEDVKTE